MKPKRKFIHCIGCNVFCQFHLPALLVGHFEFVRRAKSREEKCGTDVALVECADASKRGKLFKIGSNLGKSRKMVKKRNH